MTAGSLSISLIAPSSEAADKVREARAAEIRLRTAERERNLISMAEALGFADHLLGRVRYGAECLPAQIGGRDLELRRRADMHVRNYLLDLATYFGEQAEKHRKGKAA